MTCKSLALLSQAHIYVGCWKLLLQTHRPQQPQLTAPNIDLAPPYHLVKVKTDFFERGLKISVSPLLNLRQTTEDLSIPFFSNQYAVVGKGNFPI